MSSVLNAHYYSKVDLRAHAKIENLVPIEWRIQCPESFNLVDRIATKVAKCAAADQLQIIPAEEEVFASFKECLPKDTKVVFIGERPSIGGNGKCFDMPKSIKMPPSLRHIINDVERETGRPSLALSNAGSYLRHLPKQGVLLLNYSLTRFLENEMSHRRYWSDFSISLVKEMQTLKNVTFVVTDSRITIGQYISKYNDLHYYFPGRASNGLFAMLAKKYNILF